MSLPFPAGWFVADAGLVAAAAWLAVPRASAGGRGLERGLAWGLLALMLVVASAAGLGFAGGLGQPGFLLVHAAVLLLLGFVRRGHLREDFAAAGRWPRELLDDLAATRVERWAVALLAGLVVVFLVLAATAQPVVFDALTYRLSRVAHWLQAGRITPLVTDDARLNYMSDAPDLFAAWLLTSGRSGFALAAVGQALAGGLALGATIGLARLTGLGRLAALGAAGLLLGLPNVAPQFTAAYTDLFATGVLAAGYALWLMALRRGEGSWVGGAAAGLALGAKGTVVFFAPGLLAVTLWLAWRHRVSAAAWGRTLVGAAVGFALFVLPLLVRNQQQYGYVLGAREFVTWHEGGTSAEKLRLNLQSAFVQLCEPNSQPPWWRAPARATGEAMLAGLPEQDPSAFNDFNRRAQLEKVYALAAPDADVASTGLWLPVLALGAVGLAWRRRREPEAELALLWAGASVALVFCLHWRLQWHPYLFRFLVLLAPWLAVLAMWVLVRLPRPLALVAGIVTAATTIQAFGAAMTETYQSGWPATVRPGQSTGYYVYAQWRSWSATLDRPGEPLRPALDVNAPLAAFYRQESGRCVEPEKLSALHGRKAEERVRPGDGWVIVPVAEFLGHEGRVLGRTWLFDGDERHPYSLAAWRALQPGEQPVPLLYRNRLVPGAGRRELLARTWEAAARFRVSNRSPKTLRVAVTAGGGRAEWELAAGKELVFEAPATAAGLVPLTLEAAEIEWLEIRLAP